MQRVAMLSFIFEQKLKKLRITKDIVDSFRIHRHLKKMYEELQHIYLTSSFPMSVRNNSLQLQISPCMTCELELPHTAHPIIFSYPISQRRSQLHHVIIYNSNHVGTALVLFDYLLQTFLGHNMPLLASLFFLSSICKTGGAPWLALGQWNALIIIRIATTTCFCRDNR